MTRTALGRRELLAAAAATAVTVASTGKPLAQTVGGDAGAAGWDDGLALPIPYQPRLGTGKRRALVLGGGGPYVAAWMIGYFHALKRNGVDVADADIAVGTSAGSLIGASLLGGQLWRMALQMDLLADFPKLFAEIMPQVAPNESQVRALKIAVAATEADPETLRSIGRAAMASRNATTPESFAKSIKFMIGQSSWPSPKLHTTANDCYTGERVVVSADAGVPINDACAASSAAPGVLGPIWLKDRLCMDGGICQTSTHSDVVAGAERALVISVSDGGQDAVKLGLRISGLPNTLQQEVAQLRQQGTQVALKVAGLLPGVAVIDSLMDPKWIGPCMAYGHQRGLADVEEMKLFWN